MVGPLATAVVILGVSEFNHYSHLMWVAAFLLAYRPFEDYVLAPHLMRRGVQLHPLLVLFGVLAGGEIGNVLSIFLSVPVLAMVRLIYCEVRREHWGRGG